MIRAGDWTPTEDAALLEWERSGTPDRELARMLSHAFGRPFTVDAIQKRRARLRKRGADIPVDVDLSELRQPRHAIRPPAAEAFDEEPGTEPFAPVAEAFDTSPAPYVPNPPRGPADKPHYIPEGHELGGVSRLTDANGDTRAEWSKTRVAGADRPPVAVPESFLLDRASVMRRGDGSTVVEWASYKRDAVAKWDDVKAAIAEHVATYVRAVDPVEPPAVTDADRLTVYPIGDPHIGMLAWAGETGENFDLKIAERELCECFRQLVARSPASDEAIVTNLGDFWHAQDNEQRTPQHGNKLDVDGRFGKVGKVGLSIVRALVDEALKKHARVKFRSIPGNHDPTSALWLPLYLQAVYEGDPRVTIEDGFAPYQYDTFGRVLIGWAHGDGCKLEDLGEIMATDVPELWGASLHRVVHSGHVHHLQQKELRGCVVYTHRTLAPRDAWHHHSGYRSRQSLQALTYHREYGLDSVAVVGIERVRAALVAA